MVERRYPRFGIASALCGLAAAILPVILLLLGFISAKPDTFPNDFEPPVHALGGLVLGVYGAIPLSACGVLTAVISFARNERRLLPVIGLVLCLLVGGWWVLKFSGF
jgi:hypothetical protein